jgi:hypothetical protein
MKKQILFLIVLLTFATSNAQNGNLWNKVSKNDLSNTSRQRQNLNDDGEVYFTLDLNGFRQTFQNATDKFSNQPGIVIELPNRDGEIEQYFAGQGITDTSATLSISVSPNNMQTMIFRANYGNEFIEPYDKEGTAYVVYTSANRNKGKLPFNCSTVDAPIVNDLLNNSDITNRANTGSYKTMRLALSCVGEYSNYFGATSAAQVANVITAFNNTMTRVNGIMEKDLSIHLNITSNSTNVIYYNAISDPYSDAAAGSSGAWNGELQATLTGVLGDSTYDIGHLFGASGGGGNAGCIGCVCVDGQKGSGFTSPADGIPSGDNFDIDYVVHEMGHQLGGTHSFTFNFEGSTAQVEPGSGSTIMGYAGITSYDVQAHSNALFCYKNILQIQLNMGSKTCPVSTPLTGINATPVVTSGGGPSTYTIPISTAFVLTGTATDANAGDVLTYIWEENDLGTASTTNASSRTVANKTAGPNYRIFKPSTSLTRYFPQMGRILTPAISITTGSNAYWETTSSVARSQNFTFTARDNHPIQGQTNTAFKIVATNATGGAFSVTSQTAAGISYPQGSIQTVTWNAGSTASAPFNAPTVDILLSTNASTAVETINGPVNPTTWTTIASGVPNNGTASVTIPVTAPISTTCRFMVKAVGNIFFAVNSRNFAISVLANEEFGLDNFAIYPNPNNGDFTIQFDSASSNEIVVNVNDIRGRAIFSNTYQSTGLFNENIKLNNLQAGIYLITVQDGNRKEVKKIVIE